jgi:Pretoxin HINT domain
VVPAAGALVETGDVWEPCYLSGPGGGRVVPVSEFLRDLQATGRPATTQRSYALALLRWFRPVHLGRGCPVGPGDAEAAGALADSAGGEAVDAAADVADDAATSAGDDAAGGARDAAADGGSSGGGDDPDGAGHASGDSEPANASNNNAGAPGDGDPGPTCGGSSFSAGTRVLLASGAAVAISSLKVGDKVLATSTKTGKTTPEKVAAVLLHHDTDLYDLTVKTSRGTEVIDTTSSHLFWDPYLDKGWIPAKQLKPGTHLKTPDGQVAVVVGGSVPAVHDGWMWDLTVPGNNDHDFYVTVATTAVLVHNCDWTSPESLASHYADHGEDLGYYTQSDYEQGSKDLMCGSACDGVQEKTSLIENKTYRWNPSTNEFGVKDATSGKIINYFDITNANGGPRAYWLRQPGV